MYFEILRCGLNRWTSIWGDPLVTGLVIMGLFLVAAGLCARAAMRAHGREAMFWALAAVAAMVLAANVHLDLHVLLKSIGHCAAKAQGWYDQRESARSAFLVAAAFLMIALLLAIALAFWRQLITNIVMTFGFALTIAADAAKGFGRNGWEGRYDVPVGPVRLLDLPEIIGAALVIIGAALALRRLRGTMAWWSDQGAGMP